MSGSKIKVIALDSILVNRIWVDIESLFAMSIEKDYFWTTEDIKRKILNKEYLLLLAVDNSTYYMATVLEKVDDNLLMPHLGGIEMSKWADQMAAKVIEIADAVGCKKIIQIGARPGWAMALKKHGAKVTSETYELEVNHG